MKRIDKLYMKHVGLLSGKMPETKVEGQFQRDQETKVSGCSSAVGITCTPPCGGGAWVLACLRKASKVRPMERIR